MLLEATVEKIRPLDGLMEAEAQRRIDSLTKPQGSLGRLEELARRISGIQGQVPPRLGRKLLFVFAGDHGITEEGVSAYPKEVTAQMTYNFLDGGAAINVLARHYGVEVEVVDMGVDYAFPKLSRLRDLKIRRGTSNFARGPAMRREEAAQSIEAGIRLVEEAGAENLFLLGAGEMGIGNTSSAAAIFCALTGAAARDAAGRGTGVDDETWARKIAAVDRGLKLNRPDPHDPLDILTKVGGFEIGALTGVMLGAAAYRVPMLLDGYISTAAALLAVRMSPPVRGILIASHLSAENGHRLMLDELHLIPYLDLGMRLGEGTGACVAIGLAEAAVKMMREMATFDSAGVKGRLS
jgi:nicotinate-nucleotide--dimethylbenzimidazole phosphoribosyltransferase